MKAMLIIEMPDDVKLDEWSAVKVVVDRIKIPVDEMIQGIAFDESKTFAFVPLRPLPKRKNKDFHPNVVYANGWNDCLDALKGGETE